MELLTQQLIDGRKRRQIAFFETPPEHVHFNGNVDDRLLIVKESVSDLDRIYSVRIDTLPSR